jgi:hypothetical protein
MNMTDVREFVKRWIDEKVEIDSGAVTNSGAALGDFIEWLKNQKDWGFVRPDQWSSAMKQKGFDQEKDSDDDAGFELQIRRLLVLCERGEYVAVTG